MKKVCPVKNVPGFEVTKLIPVPGPPPPPARAEAIEVRIETVEVPPTRVDIRTLMRVNAAVLNCHQPVPVVELA